MPSLPIAPRRVRASALSTPSPAAANGAGQWLFRGELAGQPRQNSAGAYGCSASSPSSPCFGRLGSANQGTPLARSRSAAGASSSPYQPLRRVSLALRPLPKRPPSLGCHPGSASSPMAGGTPLRRCHSEQASLRCLQGGATSWLESLSPTGQAEALLDQLDCASEASPTAASRGQTKPMWPVSHPWTGQANERSPSAPSALKKDRGSSRQAGPCRETTESSHQEWFEAPARHVRFLERTRKTRSLRCSGDLGSSMKRHQKAPESTTEPLTTSPRDADVCSNSDVAKLLEKELSRLRKKHTNLENPGTPRLLENELLGAIAGF